MGWSGYFARRRGFSPEHGELAAKTAQKYADWEMVVNAVSAPPQSNAK